MFTRVFGSLTPLRARPLPDLGPARLAISGYRQWPINIDGESHAESIAPAQRFGLRGRNHYARERNPPYWRVIDGSIDALLVREGVGAKLKQVDARLAESGLRLHLYDAWRPTAVQAYFHNEWMPQEVRARQPGLSDEAVQAEVRRYWSAPTVDPLSPAPHNTGAAVDLTIKWDDDEPLYMGSLFDDTTALAHADRFERYYDDAGSYSVEEARANRRLLYWVMTEAGFLALPDEWWHFSWGDQMWAKVTGVPAALYGVAIGPTP